MSCMTTKKAWNPCFTRFFVEVFELTFPSKRATKTSRNVYKHPLTGLWTEWIYKHEHLLLQGFLMELLKCSRFQRKKTKRSKRFFYHKSHNIISMLWKRVYGSLASTPNCKIILFFWIRKISIWLFHCNSSHKNLLKFQKILNRLRKSWPWHAVHCRKTLT